MSADIQRKLQETLATAQLLVAQLNEPAPQIRQPISRPGRSSGSTDTPQPEPQSPFDGPLIVRPLRKAFDMLGVGNTKGHELINEGILERVKLGPRASGITMASIKRVAAEGV